MAGAGVVAEALEQVSVPHILITPAKFLKWDDVSSSFAYYYFLFKSVQISIYDSMFASTAIFHGTALALSWI